MRVVACDPEVDSPAFAVFDDGVLKDFRLVRKPWFNDVLRFFKEMVPDVLVIEQQYLPVGGTAKECGGRYRSVALLLEARVTIKVLAMLCGVEVVEVYPSTWQSLLGGSRLGREVLKQKSKEFVEEHYSRRIGNHNVCDSICIGHWYLCVKCKEGVDG